MAALCAKLVQSNRYWMDNDDLCDYCCASCDYRNDFYQEYAGRSGEFPDGDAEHAEDIKAVVEAMKHYKSPFTIRKVLATTGHMGYWRRDGINAHGQFGICGLYCSKTAGMWIFLSADGYTAYSGRRSCVFGSALIGILDQKLGTKKAIYIYAVIFIISMILALFHAQSLTVVWVSSVVIMAICGGTANLIPSAIICKFGRWDFPAVSRVVQSLSELGAGVGIMLTGLFHNYQHMYYFGIVCLIVGLIMVAFTKFDLIGKVD